MPPTRPLGHRRTESAGVIAKKTKFRKSWATKKVDYNFSAANDIMGIVMLEIQGATDLPRLKNSMWCLFGCRPRAGTYLFCSYAHGLGYGPIYRDIIW